MKIKVSKDCMTVLFTDLLLVYSISINLQNDLRLMKNIQMKMTYICKFFIIIKHNFKLFSLIISSMLSHRGYTLSVYRDFLLILSLY